MTDNTPSAVDLYLAGRSALEAGDLKAAVDLVAAAVARNPDNAGWRATLGKLMMDDGRLDQAIVELSRAVEDAPSMARFQILLGRALNEDRQFNEAGAAFLRATQLDETSAAAWAALGRFAKEQGQVEAARRAFTRVVQLDPHHVTGHAALADIAGQEGDVDAELHHRACVADLKNEHVPSQMQHAASLMKAGRFSEARERYLHVSTLQPDHPAASAMTDELGRWAASGTPEGGVVSVDYYDAVYTRDNHYQEDGGSLEHAAHFALICDLLDADGARSVLDLGCGPGQFAQYLRSRLSIPYFGVDYSPVAVRSAVERHVPNAEFQVLDVVTSDLPNCSAATSIVCTEVLEHVLDDEALIAKIPAGHPCYFSVPSFYTFGHVRYFDDEASVRRRYSHFFDSFAVKEIPLGTGKNRLYVFSGRRNAGVDVLVDARAAL